MANKEEKKLDVISVITTFYNAEKFIFNTLNSVNQQIIDGFDFEYVIVDDKSPDKSREIVENFIKNNVPADRKDKWKIYEPEENLGCGGARKFGIDHATGNYFMFLDADDYYMHTNFMLNAYKTITAENADIVKYGVDIIKEINTREPYIIEEAVANPNRVSPSMSRNVVIGGVAGLAISAGFFAILYLINDRINDAETIENKIGIPVIGSIPESASLAYEKKDTRKKKKRFFNKDKEKK